MSDIVWIVGASSGIGRALAFKLAREGHQVAISARSEDKLQEMAQEAPDGRLHPFALDATDEEGVKAVLTAVEDKLGPVDQMVFSAGYWKLMDLDGLTTDLFRKHFEVNVFAAITTVLTTYQRMKTRQRGRIAIISSVAGFRGIPGAAPYGASKAALTHFAEAIMPEAKDCGIAVQVIHPGFVETPMTADNPFSMPFIVTAAEAADRIAKGLKSDEFEIAFPKRMAFAMYRLRNIPYALYFKLVKKPAIKSDSQSS